MLTFVVVVVAVFYFVFFFVAVVVFFLFVSFPTFGVRTHAHWVKRMGCPGSFSIVS